MTMDPRAWQMSQTKAQLNPTTTSSHQELSLQFENVAWDGLKPGCGAVLRYLEVEAMI